MGDNGQIKWKGICRYGTECYRINPAHLKEYSHPHSEFVLSLWKNNFNSQIISLTVDKIIRSAVNGKYDIPDDLFVTSEILLEQIALVEQVIGKTTQSEPPVKPTNIPKPTTVAHPTNPPSPIKMSPKLSAIPSPKTHPGSSPNPIRKLNPSATAFDPATKKIKLGDVNSFFTMNTQQSTPKLPVAPAAVQPATPSTSKPKPAAQHKIEDYIQVVVPRGQMAKKLEKAHPYNMFMTAITSSPATHHEPLSVTFQELLDDSLGDIESSLQINFMIDVGWLVAHYYFSGNDRKPMLILYGQDSPELQIISKKRPNVQAIKIEMNGAFGIHHTKMMIFCYRDKSVRVVVSTANLYEEDWHNRTQGLWISPRCPQLPEDSDTDAGDSFTGFKWSLLNYLSNYKVVKLQPYIGLVRQCDFSAVKYVS